MKPIRKYINQINTIDIKDVINIYNTICNIWIEDGDGKDDYSSNPNSSLISRSVSRIKLSYISNFESELIKIIFKDSYNENLLPYHLNIRGNIIHMYLLDKDISEYFNQAFQGLAKFYNPIEDEDNNEFSSYTTIINVNKNKFLYAEKPEDLFYSVSSILYKIYSSIADTENLQFSDLIMLNTSKLLAYAFTQNITNHALDIKNVYRITNGAISFNLNILPYNNSIYEEYYDRLFKCTNTTTPNILDNGYEEAKSIIKDYSDRIILEYFKSNYFVGV